jgi:hypothetical protein
MPLESMTSENRSSSKSHHDGNLLSRGEFVAPDLRKNAGVQSKSAWNAELTRRCMTRNQISTDLLNKTWIRTGTI